MASYKPSLALPANRDLPEITIREFRIADYVWDFDPNENYIGVAIMAIKHNDKWYTDGNLNEYFEIEARNGWYTKARIN